MFQNESTGGFCWPCSSLDATGVAVCCSVLQCVAVHRPSNAHLESCVAVCCCMLQCVEVNCSVLQCVAVCYIAV